MSTATVRVVDVYPYRTVGAGRVQFLLLRRAPGVAYAGEWRMVGGKIQAGEAAWQAALREVREETGHTPQRLWVVPSINAFYEWQHDRVNLIPAFAAALDADPHLNHEHDDFAWLAPEAAASRLVWPEQQRLLLLVGRCLRTGVSPDLIIPI
jgi:dATP pyrophosphohydrolase